MKNFLKKLSLISIVAFAIAVGIYQVHASTIPIAPAVFETSLQAPISTSSTSMTLASGTLANGTSLTGYTCFTVDSGNPNVEFICGTASGTSITSLIRGIDTLDGKTSDASLIFSHRRGADVKITDFPVFSVVRNIVNGTDTFPNTISYGSAQTFTSANQIISKSYADGLALVGCGNADTTTQGCVEVPTQAEVDAGTQLGGSGAYLATNPALTRAKKFNDYAVDSVGTDSYAITITPAITSYTAGQVFSFKAGTANTGGATLNVSGLGAKTLVKNGSSALDTGDILSGQIVQAEYDGTNLQLLSPNSGLIQSSTLASTTVKGIVEEATSTEAYQGTQTGGTGADLFTNPASMPGRYLMGMFPNTVVKDSFNYVMNFIQTAAASGWVASSTDPAPTPGGAFVKFGGSASDTIIADSFGVDSHGSSLDFSDTDTVIADFWAILPATSTGDVSMGFANNGSATGYTVAYNDSVESRAMITMRGSTGVIYATISNAGVGVTNTDISSGVTTTTWNNYRIELHLGTDVKFYVNGVLKATLSGANLYTGGGNVAIGFGRSNTSLFAVSAPSVNFKFK